jgi:RimJ/RimL family protein N-acetyltransferase
LRPVALTTQRLILRQWKEEDKEAYGRLNADPGVREYFTGLLSRQESDRQADENAAHIERFGWGFWAVTLREKAGFIGFVGLKQVDPSLPFAPTVEIGWRLAQEYWGKGYATEAAQAALQFAFSKLELPEVVAYTPVQNWRSRRVMERLGMRHDPRDDFDAPSIPVGHPLRWHVLYRIRALPEPLGSSFSTPQTS